jgi:hypothetical protein
MVAALIAARGGSKRLPRKNVKTMNGHPLVSWSIIQTVSSHSVDKVYVTTDDEEIARIAEEYGAEVINDPPRVEGQSALPAMVNGVKEIQRRNNNFDTIISILPTGPLNKPDDFDKAIELYRSIGCDVLSPGRPQRETVIREVIGKNRARGKIFDKHYRFLGEGPGWCITSPQWFFWMAGNQISMLDSELDKKAESDDAPGGEGYYYPVEPWQYADCDTLQEFELGELLMEHFILKGRGRAVYDEYAAEGKKGLEYEIAMHVGNAAQQ